MTGWDTKADFDRFYSSLAEQWGHPNTRPAVKFAYNWFTFGRDQTTRYAQLLFDVLGLSVGDNVVIVGCAFNDTGAGLAALGVNVIGTDTSAYIQSAKSLTEEQEIRDACLAVGLDPDTGTVTDQNGNQVNPLDLWMEGSRSGPQLRGKGIILDEDLSTVASRDAVLAAFDRQYPGESPNWIITEQVVNSISDAEAVTFLASINAASADWRASVVHTISASQAAAQQSPELNWKRYGVWRSALDSRGYTLHKILPTVTAEGQGMFFPDHETERLYAINTRGMNETDALRYADWHVSVDRVRGYSGTF
jgi:hypothetical protein